MVKWSAAVSRGCSSESSSPGADIASVLVLPKPAGSACSAGSFDPEVVDAPQAIGWTGSSVELSLELGVDCAVSPKRRFVQVPTGAAEDLGGQTVDEPMFGWSLRRSARRNPCGGNGTRFGEAKQSGGRHDVGARPLMEIRDRLVSEIAFDRAGSRSFDLAQVPTGPISGDEDAEH